MSQPTPYNRLKNFTQYALDHTSAPYNPSDHDAELDAIELCLDALCVNLAIIQRDDGLIANLAVHPDALSTATKALIGAGSTGNLNWTPRGAWLTGTAYIVGDVVEEAATSYVCAVAHTAGTFATDKAAGKWIFLGGTVTSLAASSVTFAPGGGIAATNVQTAILELDSEKAPAAGSAAQQFAVAAGDSATDALPMSQIQDNSLWFAAAAGTGNAMTATINPAGNTALTDGFEVCIRAPGANSVPNPTFNLTLASTATGAVTIVRGDNGSTLLTADIAGANHELRLRYKAAGPSWELLNPAFAGPTPGAASTVLVSAGVAAQPTWQALSADASAPIWQSIRSAKLDSSGYNSLISAGAALNFNVSATATPAIFDFGNGSTVQECTISADAANQSSLVASNTNFIYADLSTSTSVVWSNCLIPPQIGYAFDRSANLLCRWPGADAATSSTEDFGNTLTFSGNAQVDTGILILGGNTCLLDGTGDYVSTAFTSTGDGSWELMVWFRPAAVGAVAWVAGLLNASGFGASIQLTAGSKIAFAISSNGSSNDVENLTAGSTTITTATNWRARLVFDALAGTYRLYLSNAGAAETQERTVSSTSRVCATTTARWGADISGANAFNGSIGVTRFIRGATATATETPSVTAPDITTQKVHFLSIPERKMYEVGITSGGVAAPSTAAGTNPTMTARNRLFVAEADTGAATVSAVRNYAIRGDFVSAEQAVPAAGAVSVNHLIGVNPQRQRWMLVCKSPEAGYSPGDEIDAQSAGVSGAGTTRPLNNCSDKKTAQLINTITNITLLHKSTGAVTDLTETTNWRVKLYASRGY